MKNTVFSKVLFLCIISCSAYAQSDNYDIYQGYIEQYILKSNHYTTSGSLVYPGLQSPLKIYSQKNDSAFNRRHFIIGYRDVENEEISGTTILSPFYSRGVSFYTRPSSINSDLSGLYNTLIKEYSLFTIGLYTGSVQLNSKSGDLPLYRYGLRTGVFAEKKQGTLGGGSVVLHLDKMTRASLLIAHTARQYSDSVFIPGWKDLDQQKYSDVSLTLVSSLFPFGRSENDKKMFLIDLYGSRKIDSVSDTLRATYEFPDTEKSSVNFLDFKYQTIPYDINQYSFECNKISGGISFVWLNTARYFLKVRVGVKYSQYLANVYSDSAIIENEYQGEHRYNFLKDHNEQFIQNRYDTAGLVLGIKEYVTFKLQPFTFIVGVDGNVYAGIIGNRQDKRFRGNLRYYWQNNCSKKYDIAIPVSVWWTKGNFSVNWSCYPVVNRTFLVDKNTAANSISWTLQQFSLGCTVNLQKFCARYTPVYKNGSVNFRNAEIHYTGERH